MTPDEVLSHPPRVLSQSQREHYFEHGYVLIERLIAEDWLDRLSAVTAEFVEQSRRETASGKFFDLAPGHGAERPRVRRLKRPDERHPLYWQFATGPAAEAAADLLGPDVVFHHLS